MYDQRAMYIIYSKNNLHTDLKKQVWINNCIVSFVRNFIVLFLYVTEAIILSITFMRRPWKKVYLPYEGTQGKPSPQGTLTQKSTQGNLTHEKKFICRMKAPKANLAPKAP